MDLQFGQYRLKRAERQLLGPEGPVELSARSFDILALLLGRPDEVIGKSELFNAAWPGLVVESFCHSTTFHEPTACRFKTFQMWVIHH
jgi:DNA-binding winged helix-turn-helix (wHTH) protein